MVAALQAPGPRGIWPVGQLYQFRSDPLTFLARLAREYGDVARCKAGPQSIYVINHPDYIRDVLVTNNARFKKGRALQRAKRLLGEGLLTSEGDFWRRQRRLAQPAFHRQRIAAYARVMVEYAETSAARWQDGQVQTCRSCPHSVFCGCAVGWEPSAVTVAVTTGCSSLLDSGASWLTPSAPASGITPEHHPHNSGGTDSVAENPHMIGATR